MKRPLARVKLQIDRALWRALEVATERGYCLVKVRTDCPKLPEKLRKAQAGDPSRLPESITRRIAKLAAGFKECTFRGLRRQKNLQARILARAGIVSRKQPE